MCKDNSTLKRKNYCPQILCDHLKTQFRKKHILNLEIPKNQRKKSYPTLLIQKDIQNTSSSTPEMVKKTIFEQIKKA
jgi:hypothetical protein